MADETENDLDLDLDSLDEAKPQVDNTNKLVERIRKLSEKVGKTQGEKDELAKLNEKLGKANADITTERDFYAAFTDVAAKYPGATEYKEVILEKVKSGYSVDDAAIATLAKEGKLPPLPAPAPENPAGGSSPTQLETGGEKTIDEMTTEEKRAKLVEALNRGGK